jgi:hypothetical protein
MAIIRKGMHANPDLLLYAGSPQFEPTSGTIVGGYGAVHVRRNQYKAYNTQHGTGRFVSFADDLSGDNDIMESLSSLGKGFLILGVMVGLMVLLPTGD